MELDLLYLAAPIHHLENQWKPIIIIIIIMETNDNNGK